jgi:APA family basic amino acid/polyamine antiporter
MATALVVGNMIGSGVFVLPSALAEYGGISIVAWVVTAAAEVVTPPSDGEPSLGLTA